MFEVRHRQPDGVYTEWQKPRPAHICDSWRDPGRGTCGRSRQGHDRTPPQRLVVGTLAVGGGIEAFALLLL